MGLKEHFGWEDVIEESFKGTLCCLYQVICDVTVGAWGKKF